MKNNRACFSLYQISGSHTTLECHINRKELNDFLILNNRYHISYLYVRFWKNKILDIYNQGWDLASLENKLQVYI